MRLSKKPDGISFGKVYVYYPEVGAVFGSALQGRCKDRPELGFDVAAVVEVMAHLDPNDLATR